MSNIVAEPAVQVCEGRPDAGPVRELLPARAVPLGESTQVRRLLPTIGRRMVGAWCFVDHYGPDEIAREPGMQVPPHPHTGLQTVSWLLDGEVHHRDSLGSDVLVRPGELALMTAGTVSPTPSSRPTRTPRCCTVPSCGSPCPKSAATAHRPSPITSACR